MSVNSPTEPHHHYDPLLDERPRRRKKLSTGAIVGIIISVLVDQTQRKLGGER